VADTGPLRVVGDPEISLTEVERKRMYDMAMELHDLQRRVTEVNNALSSVRSQIPAVSKSLEGRSDLPADVKTSVADLDKELTAMSARLAPPAAGRGGGGGGRGTAADTPVSRLNQAKTGLMAGMSATSQTYDAYKRAKAEVPKTIEEARALLTRVQTLSAALAKHNITLTVPAQ
jgi:predicted  nucleic acid-binding Zn-ribbon protein